jgi:hypothetical protein
MRTVAHIETAAATNGRPRAMSTRELIAEILNKAATLAKKEVELARAELKADLLSQVTVAKSLALAAVLTLLALNMLLVALVAAVGAYMPLWLAALLIAGILLLIAGILGWLAWKHRLTNALAVTRRRLKEDVKWAKERLT